MSSLPSQLSARVEAVAGIDPELRPATKPQFGHFQSNVALRLAKTEGKPPREVAAVMPAGSLLTRDPGFEEGLDYWPAAAGSPTPGFDAMPGGVGYYLSLGAGDAAAQDLGSVAAGTRLGLFVVRAWDDLTPEAGDSAVPYGTVTLTLTADEVLQLQSLNDPISLDEVAAIYLPLSRLLSLYVAATQGLFKATQRFLLAEKEQKVPYIIGVAGSVAVGKSTTARVLKALLARWPNTPKVDLVTTDGFLLPNAELTRLGLMEKKGFPESYDTGKLLHFLADIKAGIPVSH